jgi:hypothetical protein
MDGSVFEAARDEARGDAGGAGCNSFGDSLWGVSCA